MFKRRFRLPSPAIVIAMLALTLALGGTAIAAGTTTPLTKSTATTLIKHLAPTLTVKDALDAQADGYATATHIDNFTSSTFTSIAEKTFRAPTAGYAVITATLSTESDDSLGGIGRLYYGLALDGTRLDASTYAHELSTDEANNVEGASGAVTEVVKVTKGFHTVDLVAEEGANGDYIEGRDITILFFGHGSASKPQFAPRSNAANNPST
jgi:hypothetical protein